MRSGRNAARSGQEGYVLLALLVTSAVLLIGLALSVPRMALQSQRLKDAQLIERGEQYRRAIQLYYRDHNKYPEDLDDLEDTDGVRYLRRRSPDPIGETGEWRLIHMGEDGRFEDSLLFDTARDRRQGGLGQALGPPMGAGMTGLFGSQPEPGASDLAGMRPGAPDAQDPFAPAVPEPVERFQAVRDSAAPDLAAATRYGQGFGFNTVEGEPSPGPQEPPGPGEPPDYSRMLPSQVPMDENERRFAEQGLGAAAGGIAQGPGQGVPPRPGARQQGIGTTSGRTRGGLGGTVSGSGAPELINRLLTSPRPGGIAGVSAPTQAAATVQRFERGIAGVASKSEATGVKVYNGKKAYNEWEFVFDYREAPDAESTAANAAAGLRNQAPGQQPTRQPGAGRRGLPVR
ncbi:MAG: hypothetical protein OXJ37_06260 [Bryobacterales bacterium]|nr:hypothetical protein [Bryobacterales bacterium]